MNIDSLPQWMSGLVHATYFYNCAGEWDLEIEDNTILDSPRYAFGAIHLIPMTRSFLQSFPWLHMQSGRLVYQNGNSFVETLWQSDEDTLLKWLNTSVDTRTWISEYELLFNASVSYCTPQGHQDSTEFPHFGRWKVYGENTLFATLTIWPNLFTDSITIYPENWSGWTPGEAYLFQTAAHANRAQLADSLRMWEKLSGGRIISWTSDLIEGVQAYGFDQMAKTLS